MQNVREPSPPRTPSRKNGSMENSPVTRTHFDEVAWENDGKRRRTDTGSSCSNSVYSAYDSRRASVVDTPMRPQQPAYPSHHHRPSLPYNAPPSTAAVSGHARHHSASVVHGPQSTGYAYPPPSHAVGPTAAPAHYAPHHAAPPTTTYEHRPNYYQEAHHYEQRHEP